MIQHLIDTHFHLDYYKDHQKIYAANCNNKLNIER